jgi:hypothetical protein
MISANGSARNRLLCHAMCWSGRNNAGLLSSKPLPSKWQRLFFDIENPRAARLCPAPPPRHVVPGCSFSSSPPEFSNALFSWSVANHNSGHGDLKETKVQSALKGSIDGFAAVQHLQPRLNQNATLMGYILRNTAADRLQFGLSSLSGRNL